jgi:hypothetical protein
MGTVLAPEFLTQTQDQENKPVCFFLVGFFVGDGMAFLENPKQPRKLVNFVLVFLGLG